jgi:cephalosporin-C deacetylase-like acetyl esterase
MNHLDCYKRMEVVRMFEYDHALPLSFKETSTVKKNGYTIRDGYYLSPYGGRVPSFLVAPSMEGLLPAIIFMHPGQGNRTTFLAEAENLASKGIVSLLIDAPFLRSEAPKDLTDEQKLAYGIEAVTDTQKLIQTVVDIQRGIDLLVSFDHVDGNRIAFVGHSYGATWGGVLAGVEERIKAYVLMAGYSSSSKWYLESEHPLAVLVRRYLPEERFKRFISELESLDSVHYIQDSAPAAIFFQFVYDDEYVSKDQSEQFYAAASSPKEMAWYETDHLFEKGEADHAYQDRTRWILKQLGIDS